MDNGLTGFPIKSSEVDMLFRWIPLLVADKIHCSYHLLTKAVTVAVTVAKVTVAVTVAIIESIVTGVPIKGTAFPLAKHTELY